MKLNLPILPAILESKNFLLIGAGGGYDWLGTSPIAHTLFSLGKECKTVDHADLLRTSGVKPIKNFLAAKVEEFQADCIIAVDGGVDALMRGDERGSGTLLEDSVTLAAVSQLSVKHKVLACLGFGAETEERLSHYRALENMAALVANGGFLGACALTSEMYEYKKYKDRAEKAWEGKRKSHIHTRVISAVEGRFGDDSVYDGVEANLMVEDKESETFINPLMSLYWFFDLMKVYEQSLVAKALLPSNTKTDAFMIYRQLLPDLMKNGRMSLKIPL
jgi:hypothetical protein